ncbi:MAG: hypothetical protein JWO60_196 [Frankiales bacterium]|nr:hypothetical protein [Frankiales bacterium]
MPAAATDERESYLSWLAFLRGAVLRDLDGLDEEAARWTPPGRLLPVLGVVNHLTHVEWRWIDGGFRGAEVSRSEEEFQPGSSTTVPSVRAAYRERAAATERVVRATGLDETCALDPEVDLRWVLLHLINETARHAGHADATRELLDGVRGE